MGVFLAWFINRWINHIFEKFENSSSVPEYIIDEGVSCELIQKLQSIVNQYAIENHGTLPDYILPIGRNTQEFLEKYSSVRFDDNCEIMNRNLLSSPYKENTDYIQIGETLEHDSILIKCGCYDDCVYIVNSDEGDPRNPSVYTSTIQFYILREYSYFVDFQAIG